MDRDSQILGNAIKNINIIHFLNSRYFIFVLYCVFGLLRNVTLIVEKK